MATFNAVMYKKQVQEKIMKIFSKKNPQVVDMSNPLDDIKFNE